MIDSLNFFSLQFTIRLLLAERICSMLRFCLKWVQVAEVQLGFLVFDYMCWPFIVYECTLQLPLTLIRFCRKRVFHCCPKAIRIYKYAVLVS